MGYYSFHVLSRLFKKNQYTFCKYAFLHIVHIYKKIKLYFTIIFTSFKFRFTDNSHIISNVHLCS